MGPHPAPRVGAYQSWPGRQTDRWPASADGSGGRAVGTARASFDSPSSIEEPQPPPLHCARLCLVAPADLAVKQPFKSACLLTALSCLRGGSSFYQESWSNSLQIKAPPALFPLQVSLSFSLSKSLKEKAPLNSHQEFLKGTTSQCKHSGKTDTRPGPKSPSPRPCKSIPAQGKYFVKSAGPMQLYPP